jgi:hypothetical protein
MFMRTEWLADCSVSVGLGRLTGFESRAVVQEDKSGNRLHRHAHLISDRGLRLGLVAPVLEGFPIVRRRVLKGSFLGGASDAAARR